MVSSVAVNVGANTNEPGFRGPIHPDGSFEYVPIPESESTRRAPPTYADLGLDVEIPPDLRDTPVHLDPEFREYPRCRGYTYGDPFGVKARPLLDLEGGDYVFFYATLRTRGDPEFDWITPEWGAYVIGHFELACDPVAGEAFDALRETDRERFQNNAHLKRDPFDARVLVRGDSEASTLYERALPLSTPERGVDPNRIVTELSADSGKGPWWRRPLRFDEGATAELLELVDLRASPR